VGFRSGNSQHKWDLARKRLGRQVECGSLHWVAWGKRPEKGVPIVLNTTVFDYCGDRTLMVVCMVDPSAVATAKVTSPTEVPLGTVAAI
jgi:hypothetical protein